MIEQGLGAVHVDLALGWVGSGMDDGVGMVLDLLV